LKEKKYVLFSPVGNSDPINEKHDGPMLHIIRHYRPQTAVLFLSREVAGYHKKDGRYEKAIAHVSPETRVVVEETDIENAHDFDAFLNRFSASLKRMKREDPDSEILVNVSSGTAQMQTTLCILAAAGPVRVKPVQVSTHTERSNFGKPEYDLGKEITENEDGHAQEPGAKNRCIEPAIRNHVYAFAVSQIKRFISDYDYLAAWEVARENPGLFEEEFISMLKMAADRSLFRVKTYSEMKKRFGDGCFPLPNNDYARLLEYYLIMDVNRKKDMVADYVLRLSPISAEIGKKYAYQKLDFNLRDHLDRQGRLIMRDIPKEIRKYIREECRDPVYVNLRQILDLVSACASAQGKADACKRFINKLARIRDVEEKVRNPAAHELETITAPMIKEKTGITLEVLDRNVREALVECANGMIKTEYFNLYDRMNGVLIEKADESLGR
jgi:CRISPR type III-A/MTUBE-associated protein Csm6